MTEREKVLLRREGFVEAMTRLWSMGRKEAERRAAEAFPLPKVKRRRVVDLHGYKYEVDAYGNLAVQCPGYTGLPLPVHNRESLTKLLDLLDNPDEEVEE